MNCDVALIMEGKYVAPENADWYVQQVLDDDQALIDALDHVGISSTKVDWRDDSFDWTSPKLCLFRSIWDYFHHFQDFQRWLDQAGEANTFINPIAQIKWNMDKHYLIDLEQRSIPIVPSYFIAHGDQRSLAAIHKELGWDKTVIKPCVSGGGRHTYLLTNQNMRQYEELFQSLIAEEAFILQPFQEQITTKGEVSHILINGEHTHSILKRAKKGDYRVQDDFGGTLHSYEASDAEISFAKKVVEACETLPLYARVDLIWDNEDKLALSEVELIEPELWFREHPQAAEKMALAIKARLSD